MTSPATAAKTTIAFTAILLFLASPGLRAGLASPGDVDAVNAAHLIASGGPAAADRIIDKSGVNRSADPPTAVVREPITPSGLKPAGKADPTRTNPTPKPETPKDPKPDTDSQSDWPVFRNVLGIFVGAVVGGALASGGGLAPAVFGAVVGLAVCSMIAGWGPFK